MNPLPAEINVNRPGAVFLLGRDPGEQEVGYRLDEATGVLYPDGRPFVGPAGVELERVLTELALRRQDVNIGNVVPWKPPYNDFKQHDEAHVQQGLEALGALLHRLKPSLIVALGNEAAYATIPGWPTNGRGIYGAKGIEERRGFFYESPFGMVLATLHPAGVLRKVVPGAYLLENDFRRARKWLTGKLPREAWPQTHHLTLIAANRLLHQQLVAWDVETKWDNTSISMSGFCGDDLVPYVGLYPGDWDEIQIVLRSQVPKVGHNGLFDLPMMAHAHALQVQGYRHDTMHMWWALEPELAGQEEGTEMRGAQHMTRKGLAFLTTIYDFNIPWWKDYPLPEDPDYLEKMVAINTVDTWATRQLASSMLPEMRELDVLPQYERSIELIPFCERTHLRGLRINEALRRERQDELETRRDQLRAQAEAAGLTYIREHRLEYFQTVQQCPCCGGGKVAAKHCWRCAGLAEKPEVKLDYLSLYLRSIGAQVGSDAADAAFKKTKVAFLKELMPPCAKCGGTGKLYDYAFNPMSDQQIRYLLYEAIGVPKSYQKGKVVSDEAALKKIIRWCS